MVRDKSRDKTGTKKAKPAPIIAVANESADTRSPNQKEIKNKP